MDYILCQVWISQLWNVGSTFGNQYNTTYQEAKDKNHILIDTEKTFDNFFLICSWKTLSKLGIKGKFFNMIKISTKNLHIALYLVVRH